MAELREDNLSTRASCFLRDLMKLQLTVVMASLEKRESRVYTNPCDNPNQEHVPLLSGRHPFSPILELRYFKGNLGI